MAAWDWFKKKWTSLFLFAASAFFAGGIFALSVWAGATQDSHDRRIDTLIGIIFSVGVVIVATLENMRNSAEKRRAINEAVANATTLAMAYSYTLVPLTKNLATMANEVPAPATSNPATLAAASQVLFQVLDGAVRLSVPSAAPGAPVARSAFYRFDSAANTFTRELNAGRSPAPRLLYTIMTDPGGSIMYQVMTTGTSYWVDGTASNPGLIHPVTGDYEGMIIAPVSLGMRYHGVLTLDAPKYSDIKASHRDLMEALGNALAISLTLKP